MLNEVLIALQFGRRIAAHILVMIGRNGRVEHVHREVQHPVLRVFIGLDHLVHGALGEGGVEVFGRGEMAGIEVTLSGSKKVHGHQQADADGGYPPSAHAGKCLGLGGLPLGRKGPDDKADASKNEQQRTECVGTEQGYPVFFQGVHQDILHLGIGPAGETAEKARSQPAQETEAACDRKGNDPLLAESLKVVFLLNQPVQRKEAQHGQSHLQDNERHGHRPELVV